MNTLFTVLFSSPMCTLFTEDNCAASWCENCVQCPNVQSAVTAWKGLSSMEIYEADHLNKWISGLDTGSLCASFTKDWEAKIWHLFLYDNQIPWHEECSDFHTWKKADKANFLEWITFYVKKTNHDSYWLSLTFWGVCKRSKYVFCRLMTPYMMLLNFLTLIMNHNKVQTELLLMSWQLWIEMWHLVRGYEDTVLDKLNKV